MRATDAEISAVIRELETRDGRTSGAKLRQALAQRHGGRGCVARVYRLLAESRGAAKSAESADLAARVRELEAQLAAMRARAELAEYREVAHQDSAAIQIYDLRQRLRRFEQETRVQGVQHEQFMRTYKEMIALRRRVAELESGRVGVIEGERV